MNEAETRAGATTARGLAAVGYGLVIASPFTALITGFAAWVLALVNRKHPDPLVRSHFRNQLRITDIFGLASAVGIGLALWGGWTVLAPLFDGGEMVWTWTTLSRAGGLAVLGLAVWGVGTIFAVVASIAGLARLASARPARDQSGGPGIQRR